ncbi:MAG: DEAD/DEAH box helicase, partial [Desertimonas sp.]
RAAPAERSQGPARFSREAVVQWSVTATDHDGPVAISEAELARAVAAGATLLHTGRKWVRIDPAALRRARKRMADHVRDHSEVDALTLVRLAAAGDADIDVADDATTGAADVGGWAGELLTGLPDEALRAETESVGFHGTLRPYQRRGLGWLRFLARLGLGGCLADDMGLGKTATTLAHLLDRSGPHLVVCPLSVVHNWEAEARRFTPSFRVLVHHGAARAGRADDGQISLDGLDDDAPPDLTITTYGLLARDIDHLTETAWSTLVLDEAQMVKNPGTNAARAVRALTAGQKLALTGTPVENRLGELWAILDAVNPGMLGSRERFRHRFANPIERDGDGDKAAELRRLTQPFVLRRTKADRSLVPDLPDKIEQIAWAGLTREQATLYQQVVDQLLANAPDAAGMKRRGLVLAALTRLKQICNHPVHALGDHSRLAGRSGKLARFDELVDELLDLGERALVFTQFVEMGELLQRHLTERLGMRAPFLHGGVSKSRRDGMVADFQAGLGAPMLLVSLKAGGTGLNLTAASQVIHYDRWWNPAVEDQATDRAWRLGQGRTVNVHKLVCEGTVEERINTLIDEKRALAETVVGTGETWLSELSTDDLRQLVRLDASATS